jgi:hypothetical protein
LICNCYDPGHAANLPLAYLYFHVERRKACSTWKPI